MTVLDVSKECLKLAHTAHHSHMRFGTTFVTICNGSLTKARKFTNKLFKFIWDEVFKIGL